VSGEEERNWSKVQSLKSKVGKVGGAVVGRGKYRTFNIQHSISNRRGGKATGPRSKVRSPRSERRVQKFGGGASQWAVSS